MDSVLSRRLAQEVVDTYGRALTGGFFYLVAWLVVGGYAGMFARAPLLAWGLSIAFSTLAAARFLRRPPGDADQAAMQRWLRVHWGIVLASAGLWGGVFAWAAGDAAFTASRTAALLATLGLATAFAHTFSMRRAAAFVGIGLLYLPGLLVLWLEGTDRPSVVVMLVYLVYVVLATLRAHADYQQRLDLDQELRDQRDLFAQQSRFDALTGLANRRQFADSLAEATHEARRQDDALSLLVLDLDHFKAVNDQHGHAVGDACLAEFAARLREEFSGAGELAARLGGEEFGVLLQDCSWQQACVRAERLRHAVVSQPLVLDGVRLAVTVSVGVAQFDRRAHRDGEDLYRAADHAVYEAKRNGRNRVCGGSPAVV